MLTTTIQLGSTARDEQTDPFAGGRYRLLSRLSSSGSGELCLVQHRALGKHFLAKLLNPCLAADPQALDRLRLEAQAMGRLRHPNVVGIVGFEFTSSGIPYLVMDLVRGPSLEQELTARRAIPIDQALEWTRQLLAALEATHALGLVHRDIQPRNLLVHRQPEGGRILKLLNFGTARVTATPPDTAPRPLAFPTTEGTFVGTPRYASPEAIRGQAADARSDLYQVGLVLHWMLTGFDESTETPDSAVRACVARPCSSTLPADVESLVRRALAEDPQERFQSAAEFRTALPDAASAVHRAERQLCAAAPNRDHEAAQYSSRGPAERLPQLVLILGLFLLSAATTVAFGLLLSRWW